MEKKEELHNYLPQYSEFFYAENYTTLDMARSYTDSALDNQINKLKNGLSTNSGFVGTVYTNQDSLPLVREVQTLNNKIQSLEMKVSQLEKYIDHYRNLLLPIIEERDSLRNAREEIYRDEE